MPGAREGRAAVFTSQPQAVEVYQAGAWWAGELLGWQHGVDGSCRVRVRVVLGGIEETAWTDLVALRLPPADAGPASAARATATQVLSRASTPGQDGGHATSAVTTELPATRLPAAVTAARAGGRRRAPETAPVPETASSALAPALAPAPAPDARPGGRRRAPEAPQTPDTAVAAAVPAVRTGGRRRAPEVVPACDAPATVIPGGGGAAAGRHRAVAASADSGRHRCADTGQLPVLPGARPTTSAAAPPAPAPATAAPATVLAAVPAARPAAGVGGRPLGARRAVGETEPELLTRPMRLGDLLPHARRPRVDGSLGSA